MKSLSDRAVLWPLIIAGFLLFKSLVGNSSFLFEKTDTDADQDRQEVTYERSR